MIFKMLNLHIYAYTARRLTHILLYSRLSSFMYEPHIMNTYKRNMRKNCLNKWGQINHAFMARQ